jgi:bromodomain-containing protein 8
MVHSQISQHRNGNIFHNPIKTSEAPDYYDIVKRPTDLKTIKARIREGQITSSDEFQRDVYLMFANSLMYNRPGSDIFNMAEEVRVFPFIPLCGVSWKLDDAGERGTN